MSRPLLLTGLPTPAREALAQWLGCACVETGFALDPPAQQQAVDQGAALAGLGTRRPVNQAAAICSTPAAWLLADHELPSLRVVAGYQAPWFALDGLLASASSESAAHMLERWCEYHEQLLSWRARFASRTLLFNADQVDDVFDRLQVEVAKLAAMKTRRPASFVLSASGHDVARATLFATLLERLAPRAIDVYRELEGCAALFGRDPEFDGVSRSHAINVEGLTRQWARSVQAETELPKVALERSAAQAKLQVLEQQSGQDQARVAALESELTRALADREEHRASAARSAARVADLESQLRESQRGQENLIEHLHKTQEELERLMAAAAENSRLIAEQTKAATERSAEISRLIQARDEQARLAAGRQAEIAKLVQGRDELGKQLAERDRKLAELGKARDDLSRRLADVEKLLQQANAQNAASVDPKQLESLKNRIAALEREAALIIPQLHQSQEELAHAIDTLDERNAVLSEFAQAAREALGDAAKSAQDHRAVIAALRSHVENLRQPKPAAPVAAPAAAAAPRTPAVALPVGMRCGLADLQFARVSAEYWQVALAAVDIKFGEIRLKSANVLLEWYRGQFLIKLRPGECGFELDYFASTKMPQDDWGEYVQIALQEPGEFVAALSPHDRDCLRLVILVLAHALKIDTGIDAQTSGVRSEIASAVEQCSSFAKLLADAPAKPSEPVSRVRKDKRKTPSLKHRLES